MTQFAGVGGAFSFLTAQEIGLSNAPTSRVRILKPHGSLNWLLGFEENYSFLDAQPILCLDASREISYYPPYLCEEVQLVDKIPPDIPEGTVWPNAGLYLIPPGKSKLAELGFIKGIRELEEEAYRTADEIYVIGWSMPPTDEDQVDAIRECMRARDNIPERVVAINYRARSGYYDDLARLFRVDNSRLVIWDSGFRGYVRGSSVAFEFKTSFELPGADLLIEWPQEIR
jgi:hypothetical protein